MIENKELPAKMEKLILALLGSNSIREAAALADVSEATAYRWFQDDFFQQRLRQRRDLAFQHASTKMSDILFKAVRELETALDDPGVPPNIKITASRTVIDLAMRIHEMTDMAVRLEVLEQAFNTQRAGM